MPREAPRIQPWLRRRDRAFAISALCLLLCGPTWAQEPSAPRPWVPRLVPLLSYEYATGFDGYYSHSGSCGILAKFPGQLRLSVFYSALADADYAIIHTGSFRIRKPVSRDWDLSALLSISGGRAREAEASVTSLTGGLDGTRYFAGGWEATSGWRLTRGSLSVGSHRTVLIQRRQGTEVQTFREDVTSRYTASTVSQSLGISPERFLKGSFYQAKLAVTGYSDRPPQYTEELEILFPLPKEFSLGSVFDWTQTPQRPSFCTLSLYLSKQF